MIAFQRRCDVFQRLFLCKIFERQAPLHRNEYFIGGEKEFIERIRGKDVKKNMGKIEGRLHA